MAEPDGVTTVAVVGGGALAAEALAWVLEEAGHLYIGHYPTLQALSDPAAGLGACRVIALVDAEDERVELPAIASIRASWPGLSFVLLCETPASELAGYATSAGVAGVVLKTAAPEDLGVAIRHALQGRAVLPAGWGGGRLPEPSLGGLSEREREVLDLAASGLTNSEIAERLVVSKSTVKFHLRSVYARLGVRNRLEAVLLLRGAPAGPELVRAGTGLEDPPASRLAALA